LTKEGRVRGRREETSNYSMKKIISLTPLSRIAEYSTMAYLPILCTTGYKNDGQARSRKTLGM
jgi:hypothetical protein